jgi:hypothetical protein
MTNSRHSVVSRSYLRVRTALVMLCIPFLCECSSNSPTEPLAAAGSSFVLSVFLNSSNGSDTASSQATDSILHQVGSDAFEIATTGVQSDLQGLRRNLPNGDVSVQIKGRWITLPFASKQADSLSFSYNTDPTQPFDYSTTTTQTVRTAYIGTDGISMGTEVVEAQKVMLALSSYTTLRGTITYVSSGYDSLLLYFSPKLGYFVRETSHHFFDSGDKPKSDFIVDRTVIRCRLAK